MTGRRSGDGRVRIRVGRVGVAGPEGWLGGRAGCHEQGWRKKDGEPGDRRWRAKDGEQLETKLLN